MADFIQAVRELVKQEGSRPSGEQSDLLVAEISRENFDAMPERARELLRVYATETPMGGDRSSFSMTRYAYEMIQAAAAGDDGYVDDESDGQPVPGAGER